MIKSQNVKIVYQSNNWQSERYTMPEKMTKTVIEITEPELYKKVIESADYDKLT